MAACGIAPAEPRTPPPSKWRCLAGATREMGAQQGGRRVGSSSPIAPRRRPQAATSPPPPAIIGLAQGQKLEAKSGAARRRRPPPLLLLPLMLQVLASCCHQASGSIEKECRLDLFRLPRRVQPTNYQLFLRPNLDDSSFSAELAIQLRVLDDLADAGGGLCAPPTSEQRTDLKPQAARKLEQLAAAAAAAAAASIKLHNKQSLGGNRTKASKLARRLPAVAPACDRANILLHAHSQLNISYIDFVLTGTQAAHNGSAAEQQRRRVRVRDFCRDPQSELLLVSLTHELAAHSSGALQLHFTGPIRDDRHGFFRSEQGQPVLEEPGNPLSKRRKPRYMAVTHFEAAHAREAFPCFDEPTFKATFDLTIEHPAHLKALANTHAVREQLVRYKRPRVAGGRRRAAARNNAARDKPEEEEDDGSDYDDGDDDEEEEEFLEFKRVQFAQTPRMSSYLLAFAVGEFEHIERRVGALKLAVWAAPGEAHRGRLALEQAARAYVALRNYFAIEQPLTKIDFVAARELDAGAMENWGLIVCSERSLLLDERLASPDDVFFAADTITHELAHQWFGNLVTMKWWDELWLNEGFATWITSALNQQLQPDRASALISQVDQHNHALNVDAARTTHPIKNSLLRSAAEIEATFDDITYEKAAAVINMLHDYLGAEHFQLGIRRYLSAHLYSNTEALDLWEALESSSQLSVRALMSSWIEQPGFPLIRVRLAPNENAGGARFLRVDQERFLERELPANATGANATANITTTNTTTAAREREKLRQQQWIVPLAMWISNGRDKTKLFKVVLSERGATIRLPKWFEPGQRGHWLKLNANLGGFYRVRYEEPALFHALQWPIEQKLMSASDRLNVLCDFFALLAAEQLDLRLFDQALGWFRAETDDAVMGELARYIASLEAHAYPTAWNRLKMLQEYYARWNGLEANETDSWLRRRTRATVATSLVAVGDPLVTRDALELFERHLAGRAEMPAAFRAPVLSAVARVGSSRQIEKLIEIVLQLDADTSAQGQLVRAITESLSPAAAAAAAAGLAGAGGAGARSPHQARKAPSAAQLLNK